MNNKKKLKFKPFKIYLKFLNIYLNENELRILKGGLSFEITRFSGLIMIIKPIIYYRIFIDMRIKIK